LAPAFFAAGFFFAAPVAIADQRNPPPAACSARWINSIL